VTPTAWWRVWDLDPVLLLLLAVVWMAYSRGLLAVWERAGVGRGITPGQALAFGGGMLALLAALVSPLDALSAELSSAHMAQHMILMLLAAPLLAIGAPIQAFAWALPRRARVTAGSVIQALERGRPRAYLVWQPLAAWLLFALTLWVWHAPPLYEAALRTRWVHDLQHAAFLGAAYVFWRVLLDPVHRLRLSRGAGIIYLFATCLHASVLGVFLTLSPRVWYLDYQASAPLWRLTPLEDQQLAGLVMWIPGCAIYALVAAWLFTGWVGGRQADTEAAADLAPGVRDGAVC
jgi:putative membrane protein